MTGRPTRKQILIVAAALALILAVSALTYVLCGPWALLLPPVLTGFLLAYLVLELRQYQLGLFVRQTEESRAQFNQFEAILGINATLAPKLPLPLTRGWAASPDLLREVVLRVFAEHPSLVVEASSGTSTLVIAYALERTGTGHVIALEHDPAYAAKTREMVALHGLQHRVTVLDAPLVDHRMKDGLHTWYDLSGLVIDRPIDMLLVDGPPDTVGPMARYPAVNLLGPHLGKHATVLLDDGARPDERATAARWQAEDPGSTMEFLPLEKGAWLFRPGGSATEP